MLALFGAKDCEALEARLVRGEGPSARRLRHLAATLPIGEPRVSSRCALVVERRPIGVNLRCVRIGAAGRRELAFGVGSGSGRRKRRAARAREDREAPRPEACRRRIWRRPPPHVASTPSPNSRFLWTLDEEGRFGAPDPVLVAAVGANAPQRGESVEAFFRRVGLDRRRRTGPRAWRAANLLPRRRRVAALGLDRRRLIALSAAPMFGRHREFLGYRGFGVLGEEIEAVAVSEGDLSARAAEDDRSALPEAFEPEPRACERS